MDKKGLKNIFIPNGAKEYRLPGGGYKKVFCGQTGPDLFGHDLRFYLSD
jgi:hypothetical protein